MNPGLLRPINEKLEEAILFILKNTSGANIGIKKLAKLLYFADFNRYKKTYESITSEEYTRMEYGPVPKNLYFTLDYLKSIDKISMTDVKYTERIIGKNIKCVKDFKPKLLSAEEQSEILNIIKKVGSLTGKQLETLSHQDTPWQVTDDSDSINYDLVFYRDEAVTKQVE